MDQVFKARHKGWLCTGCHTNNFPSRKTCRNCEKENKDDSASSPKWACHSCGADNFADNAYCRACNMADAGIRAGPSRGLKRPLSLEDGELMTVAARPQEGDSWRCPACGESNYAYRRLCRRCNGQGHQGRDEGEWICGQCEESNFPGRKSCRKCRAFKEMFRPEWSCTGCQTGNWIDRQVCRLCGAQRPAASSRVTPPRPLIDIAPRSDQWECLDCQELNPDGRNRCKNCLAKSVMRGSRTVELSNHFEEVTVRGQEPRSLLKLKEHRQDRNSTTSEESLSNVEHSRKRRSFFTGEEPSTSSEAGRRRTRSDSPRSPRNDLIPKMRLSDYERELKIWISDVIEHEPRHSFFKQLNEKMAKWQAMLTPSMPARPQQSKTAFKFDYVNTSSTSTSVSTGDKNHSRIGNSGWECGQCKTLNPESKRNCESCSHRRVRDKGQCSRRDEEEMRACFDAKKRARSAEKAKEEEEQTKKRARLAKLAGGYVDEVGKEVSEVEVVEEEMEENEGAKIEATKRAHAVEKAKDEEEQKKKRARLAKLAGGYVDEVGQEVSEVEVADVEVTDEEETDEGAKIGAAVSKILASNLSEEEMAKELAKFGIRETTGNRMRKKSRKKNIVIDEVTLDSDSESEMEAPIKDIEVFDLTDSEDENNDDDAPENREQNEFTSNAGTTKVDVADDSEGVQEVQDVTNITKACDGTLAMEVPHDDESKYPDVVQAVEGVEDGTNSPKVVQENPPVAELDIVTDKTKENISKLVDEMVSSAVTFEHSTEIEEVLEDDVSTFDDCLNVADLKLDMIPQPEEFQNCDSDSEALQRLPPGPKCIKNNKISILRKMKDPVITRESKGEMPEEEVEDVTKIVPSGPKLVVIHELL